MELKNLKPATQARSLLDEFKAFAFKGNVIDLAIGVIIGGAFGKIVESLVKNIIMPVIGVIVPGDRGYEHWSASFDGKVIPYGQFLGDVVNFLIVAGALFFFVVKFLGWIMRQKKQETKDVPPLTKDQELLVEIRDLLRQRVNGQGEPARPGRADGHGSPRLLAIRPAPGGQAFAQLDRPNEPPPYPRRTALPRWP